MCVKTLMRKTTPSLSVELNTIENVRVRFRMNKKLLWFEKGWLCWWQLEDGVTLTDYSVPKKLTLHLAWSPHDGAVQKKSYNTPKKNNRRERTRWLLWNAIKCVKKIKLVTVLKSIFLWMQYWSFEGQRLWQALLPQVLSDCFSKPEDK